MSLQSFPRHLWNFSRGSGAGLLLGYLVLALPAMAAFSQLQKITSTPRGVGAQFGDAVALDGDTMVVGARYDGTTASQAGAAYVFIRHGTSWTQQAVLLASDGAVADKFGYSVAISGNTVVVGAFNDDAPLSNSGSAYVFVRSGTTWTQQQKLTAGDAAADQEFGNAVAINGDLIAVGEHFADLPSASEAGAVYIFARSGTVWTQTQKLVPSGGVILGNYFGESLAISGHKLVVGSDGADIPFTAAGSVYVFVESGGVFSLEQKLSIPSGANGDDFGFSVAIDGTTLVGGALQYSAVPGQPAFGAAYVYEFDGANWISQGRLTASDGAAFDRFGYSVAVHGNTVAVGAREADPVASGGDVGAAYVFTRTGATWTQQQKLGQGDPFNGDRFGVSVAMSFDTLLAGAAEKNLTSPSGQGAVYTFGDRKVFPDFDGDRKADFSFVSGGVWSIITSSDYSITQGAFGRPGDLQAPADYDGDGVTDVAVFRDGSWTRLFSLDGHTDTVSLGVAGDLPMPGDFDGDGKADLAVFRPSTGEWLRINSSTGLPVTVVWGATGDIPLLGDFDGDGISDLAYYHPANGNWFIKNSTNGTVTQLAFGLSGDIPVPADYDGDGKTDIAVYRPSNGNWFIENSGTSTLTSTSFGSVGDVPIPADYDGDGKADIAVYRAVAGVWFVSRSTSGFISQQFGESDAQPVPSCFVRQALIAITTQPVSQTAPTGHAVTFTVATSGLPTISYQWRKDGVAIGGATGATLTLANLQRADAGNYSVLVTNPASVAESAVATLTVTIPGLTGDFNHDSHADVFWHNSSTGLACSWVSGGSFTTFGLEGDGWSVLGTGDFDHDLKSDALWHNASTGSVASWPSGGGFATYGVEGGGWSVLGVGDFDGDGKADVVWHDTSTGLVASWSSSGGYTLLGAEGGGWQVLGVGDFNGDGKTDLLWHNTTNGVIAAGITNGSYISLDTEGGGWEVIGVGDFNGDGKTDLLWHNKSTGLVSGELMNGGYVGLGTEGGGWTAVGTGDFDGDGKAEVLWRNTSTGLIASWVSGGGFKVFGVEGGGWSIIL